MKEKMPENLTKKKLPEQPEKGLTERTEEELRPEEEFAAGLSKKEEEMLDKESGKTKSAKRAGLAATTWLALGLVALGGGAPKAEGGWKEKAATIFGAGVDAAERIEYARQRMEHGYTMLEDQRLAENVNKIEAAKERLYDEIMIIEEDFAGNLEDLYRDNQGNEEIISRRERELEKEKIKKVRKLEGKIRQLDELKLELEFAVEQTQLERSTKREQRGARIDIGRAIEQILQ